MDLPFSVTGYTSRRMQDQQAVTLAEVLGADPSARFTGQIGGVTDSFFLRGFPINEGNLSEVALDGVYGVSPNYHLFTEYLERVEVLKGPAALLYGMAPNSSVGGVINAVPKRSLAADLTRMTFDYAPDSQFGTALDVSRRSGAFGLRFNGLHRQGDTPLDKQDARADVAALSLDWRGERLRATLDVIEQYQKVNAPTRPFLVAANLPVPAAPDGGRNVTQDWGWWRSNDVSALGHVEYDIAANATVFGDLGATKSDISRLSEQTPTILNARGDTSATPMHWKFQINRADADTGVRAAVRIGATVHALVATVNGYHDRIANASNAGTPVLSNIYQPVAMPAQAIAAPQRVPKLSESTLSGLALADMATLPGGRVLVTVGVRRQRVASENFNGATGARTSRYDETAVTPLAGIVFKATPATSVYANYIEGLAKGDIAPNTSSNAGQVFAPYKTKQYEAGVKAVRGDLLATAAVFQITKPSGQMYGTVYSADSEQRNRGLELALSGTAVAGVRLLGGVTLLDAELTRTNSTTTLNKRPGRGEGAGQRGRRMGRGRGHANGRRHLHGQAVRQPGQHAIRAGVDEGGRGRPAAHRDRRTPHDRARGLDERVRQALLGRRRLVRHDLAGGAAHAAAVGGDRFVTGWRGGPAALHGPLRIRVARHAQLADHLQAAVRLRRRHQHLPLRDLFADKGADVDVVRHEHEVAGFLVRCDVLLDVFAHLPQLAIARAIVVVHPRVQHRDRVGAGKRQHRRVDAAAPATRQHGADGDAMRADGGADGFSVEPPFGRQVALRLAVVQLEAGWIAGARLGGGMPHEQHVAPVAQAVPQRVAVGAKGQAWQQHRRGGDGDDAAEDRTSHDVLLSNCRGHYVTANRRGPEE